MILISPDDFFGDRITTCCFTGHRNKDLPFGGDVNAAGFRRFTSTLELFCREAYDDGYRTFISGMAEGVDLICAKIIFEMMSVKNFPDISLVCALPYKNQIKELRNPMDRYYYSMITENCSQTIIVSEIKDPERYKKRNKFMTDNSSRIIGAYKEKVQGSGTLQTINMAKRAGLEMNIISLDKNPHFYTNGGYDTSAVEKYSG